MALAEGYQDGESTVADLELMEICLKKQLVGDCRAALAQITGEMAPFAVKSRKGEGRCQAGWRRLVDSVPGRVTTGRIWGY